MLAIASSLSAGIRVNFGIDDQAAHMRPRDAKTAYSPPSLPRAVSPAATTASTASGDSFRCSAAAPISIASWRAGQAVLDREPGRVDQAVSVRIAEPSEHGRDDEGREGSRPEAGADQGRAPAGGLEHPRAPALQVARNELEAKFSIPFLMCGHHPARKAGIREFTDEFVPTGRCSG